MSWTIWMATAVVIASIYALVKRYETRLVLLSAGFLMAILSMKPMMAFQQFDMLQQPHKGGQEEKGHILQSASQALYRLPNATYIWFPY